MTGLLWYDNDPKRSLADKIALAADRYRQKFGQPPTVCYVNAAQLAAVPGLRVVAAPYVLLHHLWLGVEPSP